MNLRVAARISDIRSGYPEFGKIGRRGFHDCSTTAPHHNPSTSDIIEQLVVESLWSGHRHAGCDGSAGLPRHSTGRGRRLIAGFCRQIPIGGEPWPLSAMPSANRPPGSPLR